MLAAWVVGGAASATLVIVVSVVIAWVTTPDDMFDVLGEGA